MPRGYRLFFVAAVGCVALAFAFELGWLLQPEKPNLAGDSGYREQAASYQAGGANCQPAALRRLPSGERGAKAETCANAEEEHREATNSIIAARRSVSAADAQAIAAYQQARIAAWGFGAGIVTLLAALGAAIFAERAAHHTKRSADIAHAAQRPWVAISCEIERLVKGQHTIACFARVFWNNTGDMVAESFRMGASADIYFNDPREQVSARWDLYRTERVGSHNVLLPKETYSDTCGVIQRIDPEDYVSDGIQGYFIVVIASAHFKISGDDEWHTTERSFNVGVKLSPTLVTQDFFTPQLPDREFVREEIATRQLYAGETS